MGAATLRTWGKKKLYLFHDGSNSIALRSGYEFKIVQNLKKDGIEFKYEPTTFGLMIPEVGRLCSKCSSNDVWKKTKYTPDFRLYDEADGQESYVEAKGRLTAKERKIILAFRDQICVKQGIGYAVLIQRDNKLSKTSKTRYSDWLKKNGIPFAIGERIPPKWARGDFTP